MFKDAKWDDADESVEGWKDLLKQLVDNMDIPPDDYSVKSKFMECLPQHIQLCIFADKMSVEYNSLEELYQAGIGCRIHCEDRKTVRKIDQE